MRVPVSRKARPRRRRSGSPRRSSRSRPKRQLSKSLKKLRKQRLRKMFRRRRCAWLLRCGLRCRWDSRRRCRSRTRRRLLRVFLRPRRNLLYPYSRPCLQVPALSPGVRPSPPSRCLLRGPGRYYRDRDSLYPLDWAMLRKPLPAWRFRARLLPAWLLRAYQGRVLRGLPRRASQRLLAPRQYVPGRLLSRRRHLNPYVRPPNRIWPVSLRRDRSCRRVRIWWPG
jgi:hypothetical protein